jgi:hypothetical protein
MTLYLDYTKGSVKFVSDVKLIHGLTFKLLGDLGIIYKINPNLYYTISYLKFAQQSIKDV